MRTYVYVYTLPDVQILMLPPRYAFGKVLIGVFYALLDVQLLILHSRGSTSPMSPVSLRSIVLQACLEGQVSYSSVRLSLASQCTRFRQAVS